MHAIIKNGKAEYIYGAFVDEKGIQHPANALRLWSDEELRAVGVYRVAMEEVPKHHIVKSHTLEIVDGIPTRVNVLEPISIDAEKERAKERIDAMAEAERRKYITPGEGQAMTYQAKLNEAKDFMLVDGARSYPMLESEIGITGPNLWAVSSIIICKHDEWVAACANIERARLFAKKMIDQTNNIDKIRLIGLAI